MKMGSSIGTVYNGVNVEKFLQDFEEFDPSRRTRINDVMNKNLEVYQLKHFKFKGKNLNEVITNYCKKSLKENEEFQEKMKAGSIDNTVIASELQKSIGLYLIGYRQFYGDKMPLVSNLQEYEKLKTRLKEWIGNKRVSEVQNAIIHGLALYPFDSHMNLILRD